MDFALSLFALSLSLLALVLSARACMRARLDYESAKLRAETWREEVERLRALVVELDGE